MLERLDITEDEAAGLSELAAQDLAMARDFARRAQAEEDPQLANDLARSYQRMARSYRQTLALKVRLKRELARAEQDSPPPRDPVRIRLRKDELRVAVRRVVWVEHEPAERPDCEDDDVAGELFGRLEAWLDQQAVRDTRFGLTPVDDHALAACAELGLSLDLAPRWRDLPPPPASAFIDWDDDDEDSS